MAGPPPITQVQWLTQVESDSVGAYADDQVDLAGVSGFDASWIAYDPDFGPALHEAAPLSVQYFGFDTSRPPFDDARVRQAFALALDRSRLVPLSEGANGEPASSVVPPALWPDGLDNDLPHDVAEAQRLLDQAGYVDRQDLGEIVVADVGLGVGPAVEVWRDELGAQITIESMDFADYLVALEDDPPQVFTINWIADYPSPYALYSLLLLPRAASNYGHWTDADFVRLLQAASAAEGDAAQAAAYRDGGRVRRRARRR